MPVATSSTCSATCTARSESPSEGVKLSISGVPSPSAAASACGATDSSGSGEWMRASSRRLPPQRTRVTVSPSHSRCSSRRTADPCVRPRGASTSLPLFVPGATTAEGDVRSITSSRAVAHAPGAYASGSSAMCARATGRAAEPTRLDLAEGWKRRSAPAATAPPPPRSTSSSTAIYATPSSRMTFTTAGAASGALAEDLRLLALAGRHDQAQLLEPRLGTLRRARVHRLLPGAQLGRHRGVARQVDALEHASPPRAAARR